METRNILDSEGNVIGTITLPQGTTEGTWECLLNPYKIPAKSQEEIIIEKWNLIKDKRDQLFKETEWIKLRHKDELALNRPTTLNEETYLLWLNYWQKLRDLPKDFENPDTIIFPEKPIY